MNPANSFSHPAHSSYADQITPNQRHIYTDTVHAAATISRENPYNEPAPVAACRTGNLEWLNEEFAKDPSIVHLDYLSGRSEKMLSLLSLAAEKGHLEVVKQLVSKGADINYRMKDGATPLLLAAEKGHRDVVQFLLESGADPTKKCVGSTRFRFLTRSLSPKQVARYTAKDESIVGMIEATLKNRPIDTFRHNPYDEAPALAACRTGNLEWLNERIAREDSFASRLYESGKTKQLVSPLTTAVEHGHINIVKRLIDEGVDVNHWDPVSFSLPVSFGLKRPRTPLAMAAAKGRADMVSLLLEHGASINQSNSIGPFPLSLAAMCGHLNVVEQLIKHGADINKANKNGKTPLMIAASLGHSEVVEYLIAQGADVNCADKDGATPLFDAACFGHLKAVELLVRHGAQVNKPTKDNATPFYIAAKNGHNAVVDYLLEVGADPDIRRHLCCSVLTKSPKIAARVNARDTEMAKKIDAAVKQKSVRRDLSERAPSEECLLYINISARK